ncbi:bolA-like protein 3 isoform X1 [Monodelphis domestica]|uniref:bolA-like protein 3 isoform X1 n=1 Tax=Monodelphis domestica TaxID=13616 RepID=UPI0024E1B06F|nr:bolA-like protein 3 isoform X1 [Monodelphis domestica]
MAASGAAAAASQLLGRRSLGVVRAGRLRGGGPRGKGGPPAADRGPGSLLCPEDSGLGLPDVGGAPGDPSPAGEVPSGGCYPCHGHLRGLRGHVRDPHRVGGVQRQADGPAAPDGEPGPEGRDQRDARPPHLHLHPEALKARAGLGRPAETRPREGMDDSLRPPRCPSCAPPVSPSLRPPAPSGSGSSRACSCSLKTPRTRAASLRVLCFLRGCSARGGHAWHLPGQKSSPHCPAGP